MTPRKALRTAFRPTYLPACLALALAGASALSCTSRRKTTTETQDDTCHLEWAAAPVTQAEEPQIVAPFTLTAADGTGLELLGVEARAVVEDPLAFTELKLTFRNPEPRQIEGRFQITLPSGAAISRFSMKIDNRWQEAEVVELQAARRAYEDFLHRRQDPALLEKNAGNTFSARVFPIPANGVKELIVSYSEELPAVGEPYTLLLRGLPELQNLDVDVIVPRAQGPHHLRMNKQRFTPQQDLTLRIDGRAPEVGLRFDRLAVARVAPAVDLPQEPLKGLTLLFDTSASRALDFKGQVARLGQIVGELQRQNGDFELRLVAFDQEVVPVFSGPASAFTADAQQQLLRRGALGASDLGRALGWVADNPNGHSRVLVISDGIVTAGASEAAEVRKAASTLARGGVQRIDALVDGGIRDELLLRQLTAAGLPKAGIVGAADRPPATVASRILGATLTDVKVEVPGAAWVWPQVLGSVQPGDTFLIFADLPSDQGMEVILGESAGGKGPDRRTIALKPSERPLLERAWIKASIDRLGALMATEAADNPARQEELKAQIIDLSTKFRVLSDYTALLVLETEFDYQRFGIDRRSLVEILTVGPDGIAVVDRTQLPGKDGAPPIIDEPVIAADDGDGATFLDPLFGAKGGGRAAKREAPRPTSGSANRDAPAPAPAEIAEESADDSARHRGEEGRMGVPGGPPTDGFAEPEPMPEAANQPMLLGGMAEAKSDAATPAKMRKKSGSSSVDISPGFAADRAADRAPEPTSARPPPRPRPRPTIDEELRERRPIGTIPSQPPNLPGPVPTWERPKPADPYDGRFATVVAKIRSGDPSGALTEARRWRDDHPGDELAILALGEAAEALGDRALAARAYGSLIDLFPGRADIRRMAGQRLEALGEVGLHLAVDTYAQAVAQRPDHPSSHRLYAFALLKAGQPAEAFAAALAGSQRSYPWGRFRGVPQILAEDLRLIAAAWLAQRPAEREAIQATLAEAGVIPDSQPSLRFVLNWETDANDVDFHIYDGKGGHAYFSQKRLPSGGELYADVTTGYGPECFTIWGKPSAFPYTLQGHYYSRGPMGYGMGKLQIIEHDGAGGLTFAENPFAIMKDRAYVDLGQVDRPLRELDLTIPRLDSLSSPRKAGSPAGEYRPPVAPGLTPPPPSPQAPPTPPTTPPSRF